MRVSEITTDDGYFCINEDSVFGLMKWSDGRIWTIRALLQAEVDVFTNIHVYSPAGIRADVTTHLAAEKVLRDVIALLPSLEQRQRDAIRAAADLCREHLSEWLGVNSLYLPHELRGYAIILSILEDVEEQNQS